MAHIELVAVSRTRSTSRFHPLSSYIVDDDELGRMLVAVSREETPDRVSGGLKKKIREHLQDHGFVYVISSLAPFESLQQLVVISRQEGSPFLEKIITDLRGLVGHKESMIISFVRPAA